jgi:hypothetical protein
LYASSGLAPTVMGELQSFFIHVDFHAYLRNQFTNQGYFVSVGSLFFVEQ